MTLSSGLTRATDDPKPALGGKESLGLAAEKLPRLIALWRASLALAEYAATAMAIIEHAISFRPATEDSRRYVRPPQRVHFPASEEMPETNRHLELRTALYQLLKRELAVRATIGSDQFVYYDPTTAKKKLAPDAFVKLGVPHSTFRVWKTWQLGAPDVAVEIVSDSDEGEEAWESKLERYRAAGIAEVARFDPDDAERPLRVWDHVDGDLVERACPDGLFECARLGLFWVVTPHPSFGQMLRLSRDRAGHDLLPTPEEAEQSEARARREAERSRAEEARLRAEETRLRAEAEETSERLAAEVAELRRRLEERGVDGSASPPASPSLTAGPTATARAPRKGAKAAKKRRAP